jgi:LysR family glycine cleavage system transcriptional activator
VRLSPIAIRHAEAQPYHLVYPAGLRDWPPLASFRAWLFDELDRSLGALRRANGGRAAPKSRSTTRARARAKRK